MPPSLVCRSSRAAQVCTARRHTRQGATGAVGGNAVTRPSAPRRRRGGAGPYDRGVQLPVLSAAATRRVFAAGVVAQMGIVVTGGLVRLTGSGLGCPTWPDCYGRSLVPVKNQPQSFHRWIEFGNRMLTFVVVVVVLLCIAAAWRQVPRRRPLVLLAAAGLLGVFGQAVLGGLTVLTGLNPYLVAAHFLLSMVLIAVAVALHQRSADAADTRPVALVRVEVVWLTRALVAVAGLVIVVGTLVTGSGPHSGDADHPARTGFDVAKIAWLHADTVTLFVGLVVGTLVALRLVAAPPAANQRILVVLGVTLAQGGLGYLQYFTGVPWVLVAFHVLGATALWVSVLRLTYAIRERPGGQPLAGQPAPASASSTAAANLSGAPGA
jgi:heme a synthase